MELIEQYGLLVVFAVVLLASSTIGSFMLLAIQAILDVFAQIFIIG